jgi:D-tyrosyl-tRNA(Tyr) deacylase
VDGVDDVHSALDGSVRPVRALVQRVTRASVAIDGTEVAAIGPGLLVLLGVTHDDDEEIADRLADKVRALRVFDDAEGRMNDPLGDREVLCVSQFTLYGDARKGNRPSFVAAARPAQAEPLYERFAARLGAQTGRFGARMGVESVNDGPVTLLLEGR